MEIWDNRRISGEEFYETLELQDDGRWWHQILETWGQDVFSMGVLRPSKCREWFVRFGIPIPESLIGKADPE